MSKTPIEELDPRLKSLLCRFSLMDMESIDLLELACEDEDVKEIDNQLKLLFKLTKDPTTTFYEKIRLLNKYAVLDSSFQNKISMVADFLDVDSKDIQIVGMPSKEDIERLKRECEKE